VSLVLERPMVVQVERGRSVVDSRPVVEHPVVLDSSPVVEKDECCVESELVLEGMEGGEDDDSSSDYKRKFKLKSHSRLKNNETKRGSTDNFSSILGEFGYVPKTKAIIESPPVIASMTVVALDDKDDVCESSDDDSLDDLLTVKGKKKFAKKSEHSFLYGIKKRSHGITKAVARTDSFSST
jgi:hypothetical protein